MYLLDTNVVSELRRPERADRQLVAWASQQAMAAQFVSAVTILELELGVLQMERKDAVQGAILRAWLNDVVLPQFSGRILSMDCPVALRCARLHVPDRCAERDAIIAATALVHGMTVVTRNVKDFESSGVGLLNPWEGSA